MPLFPQQYTDRLNSHVVIADMYKFSLILVDKRKRQYRNTFNTRNQNKKTSQVVNNIFLPTT